MRDHARRDKEDMNGIYYFSASGHSRAVAEYFGERMRLPINDIAHNASNEELNTAIFVFPVYCQNIPSSVKVFLRSLCAKNIALIATYGGISHGNVLWEASKLTSSRVIAAAYIPIGHTYLCGSDDFEREALEPIFDRLKDSQKVTLKKESKHIFANVFPAWRSRMGVKITRSDKCNECDACGKRCPMGAISKGIVNKKCIRCLGCVNKCPMGALTFTLRPLMRTYLKKNSRTEVEIYL